jgi:hypothetical protein
MSDLPDVKLKSLVNFPSSAVGRVGINVEKDGGLFYLDLDYSKLAVITSFDPSTKDFIVRDEETGIFNVVTLETLSDIVANFNDFYLGAHSSNPTTDNQGGPLQVGMLYWNTGGTLKIYDGVAWQSYSPATGLTPTNNLSDVNSARASKDNISVHGADIASTATVNLETATGDLVDVTGTTTITAITLNEGHERTVRFTGALTLTNGASLVLPGGANITTVAGDFAVFRGYAAGVVRCVDYTPVNGNLFARRNLSDLTNKVTARTNLGIQEIALATFNPVGDGVTSDHVAFANFIAAINASTASWVTAKIGSGNYALASANISSGFAITRSNVTFEGDGGTLTVTGSAVTANLLSSNDQSHIHYKNLNFVGNSQANAFANGGAIAFTNSTLDITDLLVEDCTFTNFKGDYWIYVETLGAFNNAIQNVKINRNFFLSQSGNCRGPTNIAINSSFVLVYGVGNNGGPLTPNSFVQHVHITNNVMRADYIKTGIQAFHNVKDIVISGNQVYNAGQLGGIIDDVGSYAIMCYENGSFYSKHAIIKDNYIFNCRDNGFYIAGPWNNSVISGNVVDTQTSTATATLPKGGISLNGSYGPTVTGNRLMNIAADGITLVEPAATTDLEAVIASNSINAALSGVRLVNSTSLGQKISVVGNAIVGPNNNGVLVYIFPGGSYSGLVIDGNNISGGNYGIRFVPDSGTLTISNLSVSRNMVSALGLYGIDISQITSGGPVVLDGNIVVGAPSAASFNITNTVNGVFQNNVVSGQTAGVGWTTSGAKGTLRNNSFDRTPNANIVAALGATDLGRIKPTVAPAGAGEGVVVQVLIPAEQGVASAKYIVREWIYSISSGAWLDQRMLTGN